MLDRRLRDALAAGPNLICTAVDVPDRLRRFITEIHRKIDLPRRIGGCTVIRPTEVHTRAGYRIWLRYADGVDGEIDLSYLAVKGVFNIWDEPGYFEEVHITSDRAIAWDDDIEFCADALYMQLTGKSVEEMMPGVKQITRSKAATTK